MNENIERLITGKMNERNYVIDTKSPELLVQFHVMVENKEDIVNTPVYSYPGMVWISVSLLLLPRAHLSWK